ncbi:unnamed protein product [Bemisia tabaci]|uniref:Adenosylmethionine-8-amino-7-oxononanoate aminotransferase n=2 Tax=Bemisia tabaci TaxID=7038 RepID=A0A9P0A1X9_BEMTA|nr:PREDICTED: uncharacterized protein LOC109035784 [Bemisia tabaci]CAH0382595.1 unnamed protein product [Bemisia tabaci]
MSVGVTSGFHDLFSRLFFSVLTIPFPETWIGDDQVENKEIHALRILERHLQADAHKIAALILEPLVQGASGMRMCRPEFVSRAVNLTRQYGILIIFDEIKSGFGRTGSCFALEQVNFVPDFLCISKGLTGGFLPLAVTATTDRIYDAFLSEHFTKAFAHGHSYTANPLGCAAGIASLELLTQPGIMAKLNRIHMTHKTELEKLSIAFIDIHHIRVTGTIAAFDTPYAQVLKPKFLEKGLLLRPLGNTIYFLPPYRISDLELEEAYKTIGSRNYQIFMRYLQSRM